MTSVSFSEYMRLAVFFALRAKRRLRCRIYMSPILRWSLSGRGTDSILLAPQNIRTSDPSVGNDIYSGRFCLAGRVGVTDGPSIFTIIPPSPAWQRALLGFGWLRHLRATNSAIARSQARALLDDWMVTENRWGTISYEPEIVARRIISWLSHSPLILNGANRAYHGRFVRCLNQQIAFLRRTFFSAPDGHARLICVIALNYAGLCIAGNERLRNFAVNCLNEELSWQILPDGGHVSRNPGVVVDLLLDLLPLRQTFTARDVQPPASLCNAIDRMMPMVRFFRHGDGSFALFNGMGASRADAIATVLAYDDTFGKPIENATHTGYQRVVSGESVLIMDTGAPPPINVSGEAHAGCLSFELSSGRQRLIVNCGSSDMIDESWRNVARMTAAHSTQIIEDTSSCRFLQGRWVRGIVGNSIISKMKMIEFRRKDSAGQVMIEAAHDGYLRRFNLICRRRILMRNSGTELFGEDMFEMSGGATGLNPLYALRFHLHPDIDARLMEDGHAVFLALPDQETWAMAIQDCKAVLEESVYLPGLDGPRRSSQIVIYGHALQQPRVVWTFQRLRTAMGKSKESEYETSKGRVVP